MECWKKLDLPWFTTFTRFSFNQSRSNKWSEPHHTTWDRFLYRQHTLGVFRSSGATAPRLAQSPNWLQPAGRRHKLPFRPGNLAKSSWCDDILQTCRWLVGLIEWSPCKVCKVLKYQPKADPKEGVWWLYAWKMIGIWRGCITGKQKHSISLHLACLFAWMVGSWST